MTSQREYHIFTTSPVPFTAPGLPTEEDKKSRYPRFRHILEADITPDECQRIFGDKFSITRIMCQVSFDRHGFTVRIFGSDVLACEGGYTSHQGELINALRQRAGLPPLEHPQIEDIARGYEDISPDALEAILIVAADSPKASEMDIRYALEQLDALNVTLADLVMDGAENAA